MNSEDYTSVINDMCLANGIQFDFNNVSYYTLDVNYEILYKSKINFKKLILTYKKN